MQKYSFTVSQEEKGTRLDKFLAEEFPQYSRSWLQKLIAKGNVLVNQKEVKSSYQLEESDKITGQITPPEKISLQPDLSIKLNIIYEDKDLLIIDKPAGLVVHPSPTHKSKTLVNALLNYLPKIKEVGEDKIRPGIVHRLDKDTSGLMIITKNNQSFQHFKNLFNNQKVEKRYLVLTVGQFKEKSGTINKPIARSKHSPEKMTISPDGRKSLTKYKVIRQFKDYALIEAQPKTGRMHQIRVHLASIGHPVAGDKKYGFKKQLCPSELKRQFIHAGFLKFKLPGGEEKKFQSKLPLDLEKVLSELNNQHSIKE